ncbi:MFS transporter (plasmid) [Alkalihalophilus sp. As8PL]|uniref:MFS transporter n=1 Tax=Alkalihalophilus sp. As8PL TaxID=3237103 RepID=A0AB39BN65_9BACI
MKQSLHEKKQKFDKSVSTIINIVIITVVSSFPVFYPGAINDILQHDLNVQAYVIGLLFSLFWLSSVAGANFNRKQNDILDLRKSMFLVLIFISTSVLIMSIGSLYSLGLGVLISGWLYGYSQPLTNQMITNNCNSKYQGLAFGIKQAAIPLATIIASISIGVILNIGWQTFLIFTSVFIVSYSLIFIRNQKKITGKKSNMSKRSNFVAGSKLKKMAFVGFLGGAIGNSLAAYLVASLVLQGISITNSGLIAAVGAIGNILVRVISGTLIDKKVINPLNLLILIFFCGSVGAVFLQINHSLLLIIGTVLAYGIGWGWPGILHYLVSIQHPGREAKATSVTQMGVSFGSATGPVLFGILYVLISVHFAWFTLIVFGALACIILLNLRLENKNEKRLDNGFYSIEGT